MLLRRANRLAADVYCSPGTFFLTVCTSHRRILSSDTAAFLQTILRDEAGRCAITLDLYCFMPDHLHLLVTSRGADVRMFVKRFKQVSQHRLRHSMGGRVWQKGYYDRVVRRDEDVERIAEYILNNPVRRGLSETWDEYPHSWSRWHQRP